MINREMWIDVPGYEGLYQISTLGNVRSMPRIKNHRYGFPFMPMKLLRKTVKPNGYESVTLHKHNRQKVFQVHVLVAMAFLDNPENKKEINHINRIKGDNRLENLEWCTHVENMKHAFELRGTDMVKILQNIERYSRS